MIKRLGLVRWTMLELLFLFVLLATSAVSLASALVKPGTASRRLQAMRILGREVRDLGLGALPSPPRS